MRRPAFRDRADAGLRLGRLVSEHLSYADRRTRPFVVGLPRGGVEVAAAVARTIDGELDVVVARKIGAPGDQELGLGAVSVSGPVYWNQDLLRQLVLTEDDLAEQVMAERAEARRRLHRYRGDRTLPPLDQRTAVVVDDGLATGATAIAALREIRLMRPRKLILAVPVGARAAVDLVRDEADELWCLYCPQRFSSVGAWYAAFPQLSDDQVEQILASTGAVDVR